MNRVVERADDSQSEPPLIAHVGKYLPDSANGVHKTIAGLASGCAARGHNVQIWHFTPKVPNVVVEKTDGLTIVRLPRYDDLRRRLLQLPKQTVAWLDSPEARPSLVHFHSVFIPENVALARRLRAPYVITPNGGYQREVLHGRKRLLKRVWWACYEERYVRSARRIHAVSPNEEEYLRQTFPYMRLSYFPNAVELPGILKRKPKRGHFVFIGRLAVQHKGLDILLRGYARFQAAHRRPGTLTLVGPDFREGRGELRALAASLGIQEQVLFPGSVQGDEKWHYLETAYAFVHPSRWDGLPFSVLEALAAGVPVLATPESNIADMIQDNGAGVSVTGNPEAVQAGLAVLDSLSESAYEAMSRNASDLTRTHFSWPSVVERAIRLYEEIEAETKL